MYTLSKFTILGDSEKIFCPRDTLVIEIMPQVMERHMMWLISDIQTLFSLCLKEKSLVLINYKYAWATILAISSDRRI